MNFMCGITGYTGLKPAVPFLLDTLKRLEYRGYDSSGVAYVTGEGITTVKSRGRISKLEEKITTVPDSSCGIAHTRWATHGEPTDINSHPHTCGKTTLVHNGIIENYRGITKLLPGRYVLLSQTDTEVACALIDDEYERLKEPKTAIFSACDKLRGSFAFAVMFSDRPGEIYGIRRDSPLIIGRSADGSMLASDTVALLGMAQTFYRPENELAVLTADKVEFFAPDLSRAEVQPFEVRLTEQAAKKDGYEHFMLKEIHEEPRTVKATVGACLDGGLPALGLSKKVFGCKKISVVACGTAMHAGLIFREIMRKLCRVEVSVWLASEFRYAEPVVDGDDLVIFVSQSGETADTLGALRLTKALGGRTLSIVNVSGSTLARESDEFIYTAAGPEIAVASTKAYLTQLAALYLLCFEFAREKGRIDCNDENEYCRILHDDIPAAIEKAIQAEGDIKALAAEYSDCTDLFFVGRGVDCALSQEASLKLKEVSYVHSEALAAGELKHGTISLIQPGVPTVAIMTDAVISEKTASNVREVQSRGGQTAAFAAEGIEAHGCRVIRMPACPSLFIPFVCAPVFQLFAYYSATLRGCDVDKPRNLAKSVTVE